MTTASPSSHARDAVLVTPDDGDDLPKKECVGLSVAVTGVVRVTPELGLDGTSVDLTIAAGGVFPQGVKRVWNTGTTATGIVAHYRA